MKSRIHHLAMLLVLIVAASTSAAEPLKLLFLGDQGPHRPQARYDQLAPHMAGRGIDIRYTEDLRMLSAEKLAEFDGLIIYANTTRIEPAQEQALLDYVAGGGAFIPLHCASYCFLNSEKYVELVGAQFQRHGTGVFRTQIAEPEHPIMKGFGGFESWDETYVHTKHNEENRTVLTYRIDENGREPWTWIRTHGEGRVFYTAWGHDQRTWGNPGFLNLVERGIRWTTGDDLSLVPAYESDRAFPVPEMTSIPDDVKPFEYVDVGAKIPNYTPGEQWGTQGEPLTKMQLPLPAEESLKHIVVPQGFHVELFASEADFEGKPIAMTWDEQGRLWVCETVDYPNDLQPPGEGRDRIRICEDTDGDGRADKFTVFAEGLSIPTSIAFHRGGAIVQNGTQTLYLKDTDGDDRADERKVIFEGWALGDTHGGVSNFRYGLDNWIWAMQGYNDSRVEAGGETHRFRQGFFRFKADGSELEFVRSTNNNTWGLGTSEEGLIFGSTANRCPSVYMPIPNRYYEQVRGWSSSVLESIAPDHLFKPITDKVRQVDQHGGYTAAAGHALYTARHYPQEYWNRTAFVCGPTGHLVGTYVLRPEGADFKSKYEFTFFGSDDEWTAPIAAEVGPDGNLWVLDWYNYIVQHNPTPHGFERGKGNAYESELRDKKHGRVYRVVYDGREPAKPMNLKGASPEELVSALKHPNMLWRLHAQRLLVERGEDDVVPKLIELINDQNVDEIGLNVGAIHALWTLDGLNAIDEQQHEVLLAVLKALEHRSASVRGNALLVLPSEHVTTAVVAGVLLQDVDPQVRVAALLALAETTPTEASGNVIALVATHPDFLRDPWVSDAITAAAARYDQSFLAAFAENASTKIPPETFEIVSIVAEHYARGGADDSIGKLLPKLESARPEVAEAIIRGLTAGWPNDAKVALDQQGEASLAALITRLPAGSRGQLVKLASLWGVASLEKYTREIAESLLVSMDNDELPTERRIAAARELIAFQPQSADAVDDVLDRIGPQTPPELAVGWLESLGQSSADELGGKLVASIAGLTPAGRDAAIRVLLSRPETAAALLEGIEAGEMQLSDLSLDQKQLLANHPNRRVAGRAKKLMEMGGGLPSPDRQKVLEELLPLAKLTGDAQRGQEVFKKQCAKCHIHRGEGTRIGPDLTGMAAHPKTELLVHILDPSRSVEGNFRVYTVVTAQGRILNGLLSSETKTAIELIDGEAKKQTILREDIDELLASRKSLMPEGFEKQVSKQEITDLLEFLTQRGKYLPLDLRKVATVASDRGMFFNEESTVERMIFPDWEPKEFNGVPFVLIDPQGGRVSNTILLHGPQGKIPPTMPKSVELPVNAPVEAIHMLSGVSGWGHPLGEAGSLTLRVRLHYADGQTEDHDLKNGVHFADYIRRVDVPESELAFMLRSQQIRYLAVRPLRSEAIERIELIKGTDASSPIIMAVTVESADPAGSPPRQQSR